MMDYSGHEGRILTQAIKLPACIWVIMGYSGHESRILTQAIKLPPFILGKTTKIPGYQDTRVLGYYKTRTLGF